MFWRSYSATFVMYKLKDNIMNYKTILNKGKDAVLWLYKSFTNKFTSAFKKLREKFPILDRYPLLKYALIPILIGLLFLVRYYAKLGINELVSFGSDYLGEVSGIAISERAIVLSVAVVFIAFRVAAMLRKRKNSKDEETIVEL